MKIRRPATRRHAAHIAKRNGAYLITASESNEADGTTTPDDLFDVASSLPKAKQIARTMALDLLWRGPFRWTKDHTGYWLEATDNDDYEYDDDDDDDDDELTHRL